MDRSRKKAFFDMKCIFIYNPVSGKGKIKKKIEYIVEKLKNKYDTVDVYETKASGDMSRAAYDASFNYDAIVFAGGDGSFNEVLQGVVKSGETPELGYIPGGTVNDIGHALKISKNIKKALKVILNGKSERLDVIKSNDKYAMYVVAAGAFTSASYTTPQINKKQIGRLAYGLEALKKNLKFDVFSIEVDNGIQKINTESVLVLAMNGRYVAGLPVNKWSSFNDGKLEMVLIKQRKNPKFFDKIGAYLALIRLFLFGNRFGIKEKQFIRIDGSKFKITVDDSVVWNFDGEKGNSGTVEIEVLHKKINMIVPKRLKNV